MALSVSVSRCAGLGLVLEPMAWAWLWCLGLACPIPCRPEKVIGSQSFSGSLGMVLGSSFGLGLILGLSLFLGLGGIGSWFGMPYPLEATEGEWFSVCLCVSGYGS